MRYFIALLGLLPLALFAQPRPHDCQASAAHRQFDFWIGQWEVHDGKGTLAGNNSIQAVQKGCALREQWTSVSGGGGESLNYYDPGTGQWRQLWLDAGYSIIDIAGGLDDAGSMVLQGRIYYLGSGKEHPFRGSWTPLDDGRVRQFFQQQDGDGAWQTWFEGFYKRSED
jgi:hypothetical protein